MALVEEKGGCNYRRVATAPTPKEGLQPLRLRSRRAAGSSWVCKATLNQAPTSRELISNLGVFDRYPKHESDQKNDQSVFDQTLAFFLNNQAL
jgi:hypothetical protein